MSDTEIRTFFHRLGADGELASAYHRALGDAIQSALVPAIRAFAAERGWSFSEAELAAYLEGEAAELDEAQLEAVAEGMAPSPVWAFLSSWVAPAIVSTAIVLPLATDGNDAS